MQQPIPAGYRKDAQGRLVPESLIGPIDRMRDDLVLELVKGAEAASGSLTGRNTGSEKVIHL